MADGKTTCSLCGREIRHLTAERRSGMCVPCHRSAQRAPEELVVEQVFDRIDAAISPFSNYKTARRQLQSLPTGYLLCFAFHYVQAELLNGGVSQLYSSSTWSLILDAEEAAHVAGVAGVSTLLREIVYYYHLKGRSKHKRRIDDDYFSPLSTNWGKSLQQLDNNWYDTEDAANSVIRILCRDHQSLFVDA